MASSDADASIVRSTTNLAHELGLSVVAEGVETDALLALVRQMGCDFAQGCAIAHPAPGPEVLAWSRTGWVPELGTGRPSS